MPQIQTSYTFKRTQCGWWSKMLGDHRETGPQLLHREVGIAAGDGKQESIQGRSRQRQVL